MANNQSAQEIIKLFNLSPHPEKGYYVETFRDHNSLNGRSHSTCIYYLLEGKSGLSKWHRVLDGVEVWHYYAGAPMQLSLSWDDGTPIRDTILGIDFAAVSYFSIVYFSIVCHGHLTMLNFYTGPAASKGCCAPRVAARSKPRGLDLSWLHGCTGLLI